jgi:hypothetical protein
MAWYVMFILTIYKNLFLHLFISFRMPRPSVEERQREKKTSSKEKPAQLSKKKNSEGQQ